MQDVIDFLREEVEKCQQIAKVAEPDMAPSWLQSAELFERAADFIEARQKGTTGANVTGNVTTGAVSGVGQAQAVWMLRNGKVRQISENETY